MDLIELGLCPAECLERIESEGVGEGRGNDVQILKRAREGKEIKEVRVVKRGKLVDVAKLAESTPENPIPIQTQYTDY